jgi:hypothetical protein
MTSHHSPCADGNKCPPSIRKIIHQYITVEEEKQICQQFDSQACPANTQVLWSGIPRTFAEAWAKERGLQTLAMAMGPLMSRKGPKQSEKAQSLTAWSRYMKGASAVFAWYASRSETVLVLTPPPPERFHPLGGTNIQLVEEPVIKECAKLFPKRTRVMLIHPTVEGAEDLRYQIWPSDETSTWIARFGTGYASLHTWRQTKKANQSSCTVKIVNSCSDAEAGHPTSYEVNPKLDIYLSSIFMNLSQSSDAPVCVFILKFLIWLTIS